MPQKVPINKHSIRRSFPTQAAEVPCTNWKKSPHLPFISQMFMLSDTAMLWTLTTKASSTHIWTSVLWGNEIILTWLFSGRINRLTKSCEISCQRQSLQNAQWSAWYAASFSNTLSIPLLSASTYPLQTSLRTLLGFRDFIFYFLPVWNISQHWERTSLKCVPQDNSHWT